MILYHPLPLFFHFLKLLLNFFLFPTVMTGNYIYRTLLVQDFLLPVGNFKPKPQADINYRQSFWRSYK